MPREGERGASGSSPTGVGLACARLLYNSSENASSSTTPRARQLALTPSAFHLLLRPPELCAADRAAAHAASELPSRVTG